MNEIVRACAKKSWNGTLFLHCKSQFEIRTHCANFLSLIVFNVWCLCFAIRISLETRKITSSYCLHWSSEYGSCFMFLFFALLLENFVNGPVDPAASWHADVECLRSCWCDPLQCRFSLWRHTVFLLMMIINVLIYCCRLFLVSTA